jgi:hypothetical protein
MLTAIHSNKAQGQASSVGCNIQICEQGTTSYSR